MSKTKQYLQAFSTICWACQLKPHSPLVKAIKARALQGVCLAVNERDESILHSKALEVLSVQGETHPDIQEARRELRFVVGE